MRLAVAVTAVLLAYCTTCRAQLLGRAYSCPKPKALTVAATSATGVALTWQAGDGASPAACSGYLLTMFRQDQPVSSTKSFSSSVPSANINGLSPSQRYTVQVRALSRSGFAASDASEVAGFSTASLPAPGSGSPLAGAGASGGAGGAAADAWACVATEGYPTCSAGRAGLCSAISCQEMARLGRCAAPYIRVQDWSRRTVTQHCASQCGGCAGRPTPRLADSMAPPDQYCCAFAAGAYYAGPNGTAAVA